MKTTPARWYRDSLPLVDGWQLHCLLTTSEPTMAAIVEPFRDIICAGPPGPPPPVPELWSSAPDPLGDFLTGYATAAGASRATSRPAPHRRSPYLRDRIADMPAFRQRARPLPMRPTARCSKATSELLPRSQRRDDRERFMPAWAAVVVTIGDLEVFFDDDSIPDGIVEIDGTRITLDELRAAAEGA